MTQHPTYEKYIEIGGVPPAVPKTTKCHSLCSIHSETKFKFDRISHSLKKSIWLKKNELLNVNILIETCYCFLRWYHRNRFHIVQSNQVDLIDFYVIESEFNLVYNVAAVKSIIDHYLFQQLENTQFIGFRLNNAHVDANSCKKLLTISLNSNE